MFQFNTKFVMNISGIWQCSKCCDFYDSKIIPTGRFRFCPHCGRKIKYIERNDD
jgi:DNA-directed RNA polymerase subunit RPC12/RpoP